MKKIFLLLAAIAAFLCATTVHAISLQVYSPGASFGDEGSDQNTWFDTNDSATLLYVMASSTRGYTKFDNVWLVISVPEGSTGKVNIVGKSGTGTASPIYVSKYGTTALLMAAIQAPLGTNLDNNYAFQDSVSDYLVYSLGAFSNAESIPNYNADTGKIVWTADLGEIKEYNVTWTGYGSLPLHFDAIAKETTKTKTIAWETNPDAYDVTARDVTASAPVPEPATMLLLGSGLIGLAGFGRRKLRRR